MHYHRIFVVSFCCHGGMNPPSRDTPSCPNGYKTTRGRGSPPTKAKTHRNKTNWRKRCPTESQPIYLQFVDFTAYTPNSKKGNLNVVTIQKTPTKMTNQQKIAPHEKLPENPLSVCRTLLVHQNRSKDNHIDYTKLSQLLSQKTG